MGGMFMAAMRMELAEQAEKDRARRIREGYGVGEYCRPANRSAGVSLSGDKASPATEDQSLNTNQGEEDMASSADLGGDAFMGATGIHSQSEGEE